MAKRFTQGFRVAKLRLELPFHPEWEVPLHHQVAEILGQRFFFLGHGAQSYVFESEDGKYVIKLFRYDQPPSENKVVLLFNACKMAYDQLREETGLIYIHLNPSRLNLPTLHCKDAVGRSYAFPLDETRFALQKKGVLFRPALKAAQRDPEQMQKKIDAFLALLQHRVSKEILNTDHNLSRNFGFLEERAIEIDFGNYRLAPGMNKKREVSHYTKKLRRWLKKNAPESLVYLDRRLEEIE